MTSGLDSLVQTFRSVRAVDLFCGFGGFSEGARQAGVQVVWSADWWDLAVKTHILNHPYTPCVQTDLRKWSWGVLPSYELLLASPPCQPHSAASRIWQGDDWVDASHKSMSETAWVVVECARVTRPRWIVVENVPDFELWNMYPTWLTELRGLGYSVAESFLSSELFGVPQLRKRMFVVASLDGQPIVMEEPDTLMRPAFETCVDWHEGKWKSIHDARTKRSRTRLAEASRKYTRALVQASTNHRGLPVFEPIRTITAQDHWSVVDGQRYRSLMLREIARGMGFPDSYEWPDATRLEIIKGLGNAVCPPVARYIVNRLCDG